MTMQSNCMTEPGWAEQGKAGKFMRRIQQGTGGYGRMVYDSARLG